MQRSTQTHMYKLHRWADIIYWFSAELREHCPQIIIVKGSLDLGIKLLDNFPLKWTAWSFQEEVLCYFSEVK